jgi:hypothetical protein
MSCVCVRTHTHTHHTTHTSTYTSHKHKHSLSFSISLSLSLSHTHITHTLFCQQELSAKRCSLHCFFLLCFFTESVHARRGGAVLFDALQNRFPGVSVQLDYKIPSRPGGGHGKPLSFTFQLIDSQESAFSFDAGLGFLFFQFRLPG